MGREDEAIADMDEELHVFKEPKWDTPEPFVLNTILRKFNELKGILETYSTGYPDILLLMNTQ
jgi:hypothetical protein